MSKNNKHKKENETFFTHARNYIFRGLLAIIPLLLCALALKLIYELIDKRVMGFIDNFFHIRHIPGLGILLVLIFLYFLGLIVSNIVGKQFFKFLGNISEKIPLIGAVYNVGKQLSQSLSAAGTEKQAFKKAVLVKLGSENLMVPGFVMNSMMSTTTNEEFYFVLVPTAPTPGSGFVMVVKASDTFDPGWSVEECLKAIVSVGIIIPKDKEFKTESR